MTKNLLLMQHGNVKRGYDKHDLAFELKDKGKRNAQRMGVWLASHDLLPEYIVCSNAEYAKVTAEKACKAAGLSLNHIQFEETLYNASADDLISMIKACPESIECLLIVGHNPALEEVILKLSKEDVPKNKKGKVLTPAGLVQLRINNPWSKLSEQCADLINVVYPKKLPALFPFPDVHGKEQRIRPAYYYKQSCVIPYRLNNGQLEVLTISSSTNKHWVVPKGIHDPGLSAQDSAAKEAFEEAGIEGEVQEEIIASYEYEKWEAICIVSVFSMKVTNMLDKKEWQESHRRRCWVSVQDAVNLIHNKKLADIIATLPEHIGQASA